MSNEDQILRESCGLFTWPAEALVLTGADRARFLHGYVTCDVKALEPGQSVYGFVTDAKGRILADVTVLALDDALWLELPLGTADAIQAHLSKYVVADRVEMSRLDRVVLGLVGPRAIEAVAAVPAAVDRHHDIEVGEIAVRIHRKSEVGEPLFTLWVPADAVDAVRDALRADGVVSDVSLDAFDRLRVQVGQPRFGVDFGPENFPQETGIENAVSYEKGCYLGQEVVARIHYRGGVNRHMRRLRLSDDTPLEVVGKSLLLEERAVGTVSSVVTTADGQRLGLAVVHKRAEPGARVMIEGGGDAEIATL
ncbi:MAG: hypothetical protein AAGD38_10840 [Acidobacteriota bacterium]